MTVLALLLPPVASQVSGLVRANASHDALEPGAYVTLGSYEGQPLTWLVVEENGGTLTLLCQDADITLPFDLSSHNDWRASTIRVWLNGEFLDGFTEEEQALLLERDNIFLLPQRFRAEADSGSLDFACSHIATLCARGYDRAYQTTVTDVVTLPDIDLIARLAQASTDVSGRSYWLEVSYCRTENLVRYVAEDGHVYFGPAEVTHAIRPVVEVRQALPLSGSGSRNDPFMLTR